jgi:SAM-dependent methyltransferase
MTGRDTVPSDPTARFSHRVADYARYRPSYPGGLLEQLSAEILRPGSVVADIGSGTGIFSAQIAGRVGEVLCVEPNREMREYSREFLGCFTNVRILDGTAEATGLPEGGVDVVTAAQAFHWFDRDRAKREFRRILRPGGWVVLLWYERVTTGDPFLEGYERLLLGHSIDYREVDHRRITPEVIGEFFHPQPVTRIDEMMTERMDLGGLLGRVASSSYTPPDGHPGHAPLMAAMTELFERCQRGGTVEFHYRTSAYAAKRGEG